ncbi:hypothetical protein [Streptomyces sp. NPDC015350]|uniref:hypothetical protein n=1 Tax=Streptomyces sp. NPDC015350 TaxID=3364955 RepID=UPI0036F8CD73
MTIMATRPRAGWYEDQEEKDNDLGPMPDETEVHQLVRHLVAVGDGRARTAGRRVRRTYAEMVPGAYDRQPILRMTRAVITFEASRECSSCHGEGGRMEDTSSDGVIRRTWVTCSSCWGTGVK